MAKIATFITSKTWDYKNKCMYPDKDVVERELEDVERLLVEGHTVEWRSNYLVMTLTMDKFNTVVKPLFPEFNSNPEKHELPTTNEVTGMPLPPDGTYVAQDAEKDLVPEDKDLEIKTEEATVTPKTEEKETPKKEEKPTPKITPSKIETPKEEDKEDKKK